MHSYLEKFYDEKNEALVVPREVAELWELELQDSGDVLDLSTCVEELEEEIIVETISTRECDRLRWEEIRWEEIREVIIKIEDEYYMTHIHRALSESGYVDPFDYENEVVLRKVYPVEVKVTVYKTKAQIESGKLTPISV